MRKALAPTQEMGIDPATRLASPLAIEGTHSWRWPFFFAET